MNPALTATMYKITDTATDARTVCAGSDIVDAISGWYPDAPAEVTRAIEQLQDKVLAGEYLGDVTAYLAVDIERVSEG